MNARAILLSAMVFSCASSLGAQWLNYPTANVPRTSSGAPNPEAPTPRAADGHPDLSGPQLESGIGPCEAAAFSEDAARQRRLHAGAVSGRRAAFSRLFGKLERMLGHDNAMTVLVDGNYLADGSENGRKKRPSAALISRLITARIAG